MIANETMSNVNDTICGRIVDPLKLREAFQKEIGMQRHSVPLVADGIEYPSFIYCEDIR